MLVATIASRCCCSWCVDVVVYVCIMFSFNFVFILPIPVLKISASIFVLYFRNFYFNSVSTWRHNCSGELERCLSSLRIPSGSYKHNILYHKKNTQPVSSLCVCTFIKIHCIFVWIVVVVYFVKFLFVQRVKKPTCCCFSKFNNDLAKLQTNHIF